MKIFLATFTINFKSELILVFEGVSSLIRRCHDKFTLLLPIIAIMIILFNNINEVNISSNFEVHILQLQYWALFVLS